MRAWVELYGKHRELRAHGDQAVIQIRQVLRSLGEQRPSVFRQNVHAQLQPRINPENGLQTYQLGEAVVLDRLPNAQRREVHLREARLTVLLLLDRSRNHLHELTVMVEGARMDGSPWTVAVHLPDDRETQTNPSGDRQGNGACGHAALHCHVGPTLSAQPKVRVPLPPLDPGEVVEWVMSQIVPTIAFEPAPWPRVVEEVASTAESHPSANTGTCSGSLLRHGP